MLTALVLDVPPAPLALARALADRPGLALLLGATGGTSYLACDPVERSRDLDPEPGLGLGPGRPGDDRPRVPRWIGVLPYEARRELERAAYFPFPDDRPAPHVRRPLWLRYEAVVEVGERVRVVGRDRARVADLARTLRLGRSAEYARAPTISLAEPLEAGAIHAARIRRALELIARGDLYQVNLARRFRFRVAADTLGLFERMTARAPAPYAACLELGELGVVSTSPELFLETAVDGRLWTRPIKGTRPRGADAVTDAELARELDADAKERAELAMIMDVERNDLGRIAEPGSVRLLAPPRISTHRTVHHRAATVGARLRPGVGREQLLAALLPSGSVTGAPKIRAMEVIRELEPHRRGLYTGAFGFIRHDGSLALGMAIRTLTVREGEGHYFAGGGIVADSDPDREVEETRWKAAQVLGLGG